MGWRSRSRCRPVADTTEAIATAPWRNGGQISSQTADSRWESGATNPKTSWNRPPSQWWESGSAPSTERWRGKWNQNSSVSRKSQPQSENWESSGTPQTSSWLLPPPPQAHEESGSGSQHRSNTNTWSTQAQAAQQVIQEVEMRVSVPQMQMVENIVEVPQVMQTDLQLHEITKTIMPSMKVKCLVCRKCFKDHRYVKKHIRKCHREINLIDGTEASDSEVTDDTGVSGDEHSTSSQVDTVDGASVANVDLLTAIQRLKAVLNGEATPPQPSAYRRKLKRRTSKNLHDPPLSDAEDEDVDDDALRRGLWQQNARQQARRVLSAYDVQRGSALVKHS